MWGSNFTLLWKYKNLMVWNDAVSEKEPKSRGINTISPVVKAWVAVEEEVSSGSRSALSCGKSHVGRAQLHFHIPGYKGGSGTDIRQ